MYARMVQSPRREDAKWENTGLRAGEAETDTEEKHSRAGHEKMEAEVELCMHAMPGLSAVTRSWGRQGRILSQILQRRHGYVNHLISDL